MKFFKNPKSKFLAVLAGIFLLIAITSIVLILVLTTIGYGIEKWLGWKIYETKWIEGIVSISMIAGLFVAIVIGAILLCGLSEALKALSNKSNKFYKKLTKF